ncbi:MAG: hypothetical protein OEU09_06805 [Rhodospirillales bacterium]|nr:hypothetical protein [Rhodospirillales bacterium]MDH3790739.1 hypothetical protein [Rhodospirillales bacterium]MDH3910991.1 hypothetical protein [Rhodospirillales bacterium]MDH3917339.1 hypothetical protein [Rhodospirillales bacterium]MDH3965701.1 hypothetical protein [Rhodospirillales bacterium]
MQHRELWAAAKLAVRAYARDPSEQNAANVGLAWRRIRQTESLTVWRQMRSQWLGRDALFPYARSGNGQAREEMAPEDEERRIGT